MSGKPETVGEIVHEIRVAVNRMSATNPHRRLLMRCGNSLISMARRLAEYEQPDPPRKEVVQ